MKRTVLLAATLLGATAAAAWAGETVTGTLVTPDGKAIKGYPVIISGTYASGSTHNWVTTTDEAGKFSFDSLPPGKYVVSPSNDPDAARTIELKSEKSWWKALKSEEQSTKQDVGTIKVESGPKMRSLAQ